MPVHAHDNQSLLNKMGKHQPAWVWDASGEEADPRHWDRARGMLDVADQVIEAEGRLGLEFMPVRASASGQVFARKLTFDAAGTLVAVGPERLLFKAGSAVFSPTAGGVTPKGAALMGEKDEFYSRTSLGLESRKDFRPESETPLMKADQTGDNVELKPGQET